MTVSKKPCWAPLALNCHQELKGHFWRVEMNLGCWLLRKQLLSLLRAMAPLLLKKRKRSLRESWTNTSVGMMSCFFVCSPASLFNVLFRNLNNIWFGEFFVKISSNLERFPALVFHSDLNATGGVVQGTEEFRMEFYIYCYYHQARFGKQSWELKNHLIDTVFVCLVLFQVSWEWG